MQEGSLELQNLLNINGELSEKGRYKNAKFNFNENDSKLSLNKTKQEDLYIIYNHFSAFIISVSKASKYVFATVALVDLLSPWSRSREIKLVSNKCETIMPGNPFDGDVTFRSDNSTIIIKSNQNGKRIICHIENFNDNIPLDADISIIDEPEEYITTTDVYKGNIKNYKYSCKVNCMGTHGIVRYKNKEYLFKPDNSFSNLHWYRGYNIHDRNYYNAFASGYNNNEKTGFNIGIDLDNNNSDENVLLYNDRLSFIEKCDLEIDKKHVKQNQQSTWVIRSPEKHVNLLFTPVIDLSFDNKLIKRNIVFGTYNGSIGNDENNLLLEHFTGCVIRHNK